MPRKVRQLWADLRAAGYQLDPRRGKGSHTWWQHPQLPRYAVNIAGHNGDDAKLYQEKAVREALMKVRG